MGLDMYLRAEKYVSGWPSNGDVPENFAVLATTYGASEFVAKDSPSARVVFNVAYWRKANQVHAWFVKNVQGGRDECQLAYVDRAQLVDLRQACLRSLVDRDAASSELPPQEGFFFGSYEYDEWYWKDLELTVQQIDKVLSMPSDWEFYYQSSW